MSVKTLPISEDATVSMLKELREDDLLTIFFKTFVETDSSPLSEEGKKIINEALYEFEKGETIKWKDLK